MYVLITIIVINVNNCELRSTMSCKYYTRTEYGMIL